MRRAVLPVPLPTALLLSRLGVLAGIAGFGKVAWEMLLWGRSARGEAGVVAVVVLVGAGHCCISVRLESGVI